MNPAQDDDDEDEDYYGERPAGWMANYHTGCNWHETETVKVSKGFKFLNFMQEPEPKKSKPEPTEGD